MKKLLLSLLIIGFLFPYNLFAAELPLTEKLLFNRQLKEFASKILLPKIRHSDPNQANIDIKNLQEIITEKILNSHEHLIELKNFIIHNVLFSSAFKEFNKSICDKIKFDSLQFQNKDFNLLNDLEFSYNFRGDKKPQITLSEKLLFKSSFNSSLHRPLFHTKKPYTFISSKDLQQEFSLIVADYQKITDVDTLNKYGPSVVERSEKILLGNDDTLALDNVVYLIEMSGNCDIALKYGLSIPQDLIRKYFLEYINKIYNRAVIVNYKYCLWYNATRVYDSAKKYDELVEYSVNIKKDIFEKLNYDNKFSMTALIGYCVTYYCEAKEKFYEIGKENCIQTINLVEFTNNAYYPTPEDKRILKLNYRLRLTAEFYAKYKQYNEAISELDIIINSPPPTSGNAADLYKDIIANAKKRKNELLPLSSYIKTDKEKIIFNTNDKLTDLKVEVIEGNNQSSSFLITAVSDNNEIAEIINTPAIVAKKNNTKIFNLKLKNFGECKIKITATSKNTSQKITLIKDIPVHGYTVYLNEVSFVKNGSPYIKLKEVIKTGTDTYIDQDILSPEYKHDGINSTTIKPVALEKNTVPNFDVKFKILYRYPISSIKARAWARAKDDEVPTVEDFVEIKPDSTDSSLFILKCKLTKDFSNNSICTKQISINYQISTIVYQNESGTQTDSNCNFANFTNEIPFYYSWKKPLNEPVYERIAYFASNWAAGINDEKKIVDNIFDGLRQKDEKLPKHDYKYGNDWGKEKDDNFKIFLDKKIGMCATWANFFCALNSFHGISINIRSFKLLSYSSLDPTRIEKYISFLTKLPGIGNEIDTKYDGNFESRRIVTKFDYPILYGYKSNDDKDKDLKDDPDPNDNVEFIRKLENSEIGKFVFFQNRYWIFTQHYVCFYNNNFYDTSFGTDSFKMDEPPFNEITYDLANNNDSFVNYFTSSVAYLNGWFKRVDNYNSSDYTSPKEFLIPISAIVNKQFPFSTTIISWRGGLKK